MNTSEEFSPILNTSIKSEIKEESKVLLSQGKKGKKGKRTEIIEDEHDIELPELISKVRAMQTAFVERSLFIQRHVEELENNNLELSQKIDFLANVIVAMKESLQQRLDHLEQNPNA